jgi:hypothetical protein
MNGNLTFIKSSNTQAVLKHGKKLKFVGEAIDFQVYQNGDDSILTLKNSIIKVDTVQQSYDIQVEIDEIQNDVDGVSLNGRIFPMLNMKGWMIDKLGEVAQSFTPSRNGKFTIQNLSPGIYSVYNKFNPLIKTQICICDPIEVEPLE